MLLPSATGCTQQIALTLDERLSGAVERVTFHNETTGFCVLQIRARGHRRPVTVVGHAATIAVGEYVEAEGSWGHHSTHGVQFQAAILSMSMPVTEDDLCRFLASGLIRGIGPALARRLVATFGRKVLDIIEHQPSELAQIHGIGPNRAQAIADAWAEHRSVRDIAGFARKHGVGGSHVMRIYRTYGRNAIEVIATDPYRLALDLPGFDFATADRLARHLDIAPSAPIRLRAGLASIVAEAVEDGHCGLPTDEAVERASVLLGVPASELATVIEAQHAGSEFVTADIESRRCLFPRGLYGAEMYIASRLRELSCGSLPWGDLQTEGAIARAEATLGVTFRGGQREALHRACRSKVLVITGGPGVGKTTILRGLMHMIRERDIRVAFCAPTGRAARRLSAVTGFEASTIHRLLGMAGAGARSGCEAPLGCDLLILDEASMVDVRLMTALLRALPDHAALLIVGDADQLPSIGPGQVLADIIESETVPVVRLREVFRQEAQSRIVIAAHAINRGVAPDVEPSPESDFYFIDAAGPGEVAAKVLTLVRNRIPNRFGLDPIRDIQVLCPVNRGALGAYRLNVELQAALNPPGPASLVRAGWTFGPGDKVMQARNDYDRDVSNGELGIVRTVDPVEGELTVEFEERLVTYGMDDLDELTLAYATTIHKAQGSEYPAVVIPVVPQHRQMLRRSLLYTGVTRGSRLVVLVGSRATLRQTVGEGSTNRRWTRLESCLRNSA